jgi:predicted ATPase
LDQQEGERDPTARNFYEQNSSLMNTQQDAIYHVIKDKIDNPTPNINDSFFFIDAPAGTGKTFLMNIILAYVRMNNGIAIATASSGIAGTLLNMGTTVHNRFKLPIPVYEESIYRIPLNSANATIIQNASVIVLDEGSMLHYHNLDAIDKFLKQLMETDKIFGGKMFIICGDFRQMLPVIRYGSKADIVWPLYQNLHAGNMSKHTDLLLICGYKKL